MRDKSQQWSYMLQHKLPSELSGCLDCKGIHAIHLPDKETGPVKRRCSGMGSGNRTECGRERTLELKVGEKGHEWVMKRVTCSRERQTPRKIPLENDCLQQESHKPSGLAGRGACRSRWAVQKHAALRCPCRTAGRERTEKGKGVGGREEVTETQMSRHSALYANDHDDILAAALT